MLDATTFQRRPVPARIDRMLYSSIEGIDCRLSLANVTYSGSTVMISAGYILISGGVVKLTAPTSIDVSTISANAGYVRIYLLLDTTSEAVPDAFDQGRIAADYSTTTTFPALPLDDINSGVPGQYGAEICVVRTTSGGTITGLVRDMQAPQSLGGLQQANEADAENISVVQSRASGNAASLASLTTSIQATGNTIDSTESDLSSVRTGISATTNAIPPVRATADNAASGAAMSALNVDWRTRAMIYNAGGAPSFAYYGTGCGVLEPSAPTLEDATQWDRLEFWLPINRILPAESVLRVVPMTDMMVCPGVNYASNPQYTFWFTVAQNKIVTNSTPVTSRATITNVGLQTGGVYVNIVGLRQFANNVVTSQSERKYWPTVVHCNWTIWYTQ